MTRKAVIEQANSLLEPLGFIRKGMLWNRKTNAVVEVIDLQVSKAGDAVTLNAGVFRGDVYREVWQKEPQGFIEEPFCTVRARAGEIVGNQDLWWSLDDARTPQEVTNVLREHVLPFLSKFHASEAIASFLEVASRKHRDPLARLHLAVLRHFAGDTNSARGILKEVQKTALGDWRIRAAELEERLGCESTIEPPARTKGDGGN
jgi:hypothetical protein